ncbi:hypothetical protein CVT25_008119 [Psilocybe cyanescens]|uniref:Uncharacterized protein n=1 Tax=Psilocybe cyanescens TaxID=93625 RepID=A0A409X9E1_PSICY|nr:hypothetical protein CVT25_008119 [Psilocybe cyanescens]
MKFFCSSIVAAVLLVQNVLASSITVTTPLVTGTSAPQTLQTTTGNAYGYLANAASDNAGDVGKSAFVEVQ